jgi:hypothetical protein
MWRKSIKKLTGLEIPATSDDQQSGDRLREDAVRQLRYKLRESPKAKLVATHNEEYGFARNIAGLRWVCFWVSALCVVATATGFAFGFRPITGLAVSGLELFGSVALITGFESYVLHAANRYAESLLSAAALATERGAGKTS